MHLPRKLFNDLLIALSLLTRLPVPPADWTDTTRPAARAAWAYPVAGAVIGAVAVVTGWLALSLGAGSSTAALVMLLSMTVTTGAMHEDGLADCADGFWGGWETSRRLEIMKDSAIGTYGVLALIFSISLRWSALSAILAAGLSLWYVLIPAIISRAAMVVVMQALPNARTDGLSAKTGKPGRRAAYAAIGIGLFGAASAAGMGIVFIVLSAMAGAGLVTYIAHAKIGGQTGDVLGTVQQVVEICVLLALATQIA